MTWGFCYIVEELQPADAVRHIIGSLATIGAVLRNPATRQITMLKDDGEQEVVTEAQLSDTALRRRQLTFQLWLSSQADVVCSVRSLNERMVCHTYSLKGFSASEQTALIRWSMQYVQAAAETQTGVWLVIDPDDDTADTDWDEVVLDVQAVPAQLPRILGLPRHQFSGVSIPEDYLVKEFGQLVLINKRETSQL
jgi:hypothetical protein